MTPTTTPSARYFAYWGKAQPSNSAAEMHLLAYHALDVAAVGEVYLQRSPELLAWLAQELGHTDLEATRAWVVFWLSLHDLGKFSLSFQGQRADLAQRLQPNESCSQRIAGERHDSLGMAFWQVHVQPKTDDEAWFGDDPQDHESLNFWARAVMGRHGQPPNETVPHLHRHFRAIDVDAALGFVEAMRALLLPPEAARVAHSLDADTFEKISSELSWWVPAFKNHLPYKFGLPLLNWQTAHKFIC